MVHEARTYRNGKCVFAVQFNNAYDAHKEYELCVKLLKQMPEAGVEKIAVRLADGEIMAMEIIKV